MPSIRLFVFCLCAAGTSPLAAGTRIAIEVRETAGIRRFSYPVNAELRLDPPAAAGARFRLLEGEKLVSAQIRTLEETDGRTSRIALDFEVSCLPLATRRYELEHGADVAAGSEPGSGLALEERADAFVVQNGGGIAYEVPRDLAGLLRSVRIPRGEFLEPSAPGLLLARRGGELEPLRGELRVRVTRKGPFAVGLRWEGAAELGGGARVPVTVALEVPRAKSWVRVRLAVADANGAVSRLGAALRLRLEKDEAFADFGAGDFVYAAIPKGHAIELRGGSPGPVGAETIWEVRRGPLAALEPYVTAAPGPAALPAAGWAHLMDRASAAAVTIAGFGARTRDRILLDATGRIELSRELAAGGAPGGVAELEFAIHLVDSPPHVGAVTSPQSMASPLVVTRLDASR